MRNAELLLVVTVLAVLGIGLRVVFGTGERRARKRDYGLLYEVATVSSARTAQRARRVLREGSVTATVAPHEDGERVRVLVFPADAERARRLLLDVPWTD